MDLLARSIVQGFPVLPYRVGDKRKRVIEMALHLRAVGLHEYDIGRMLSTNPQQISQWLKEEI